MWRRSTAPLRPRPAGAALQYIHRTGHHSAHRRFLSSTAPSSTAAKQSHIESTTLKHMTTGSSAASSSRPLSSGSSAVSEFHPVRSALILSLLLVPVVAYSILTVDAEARAALRQQYPTVYRAVQIYLPDEQHGAEHSESVVLQAGQKIGHAEQQLQNVVESAAAVVQGGGAAVKDTVQQLTGQGQADNKQTQRPPVESQKVEKDSNESTDATSDSQSRSNSGSDTVTASASVSVQAGGGSEASSRSVGSAAGVPQSSLTEVARAQLDDDDDIAAAERNAAETQRTLTELAREIRQGETGETEKTDRAASQSDDKAETGSSADAGAQSPVVRADQIRSDLERTLQSAVSARPGTAQPVPQLDEFLSKYGDDTSERTRSSPAVYSSADRSTKQLEDAAHQLQQLIQTEQRLADRAQHTPASKQSPRDGDDNSPSFGAGGDGGSTQSVQKAQTSAASHDPHDADQQSSDSTSQTRSTQADTYLSHLAQRIEQMQAEVLQQADVEDRTQLQQELYSMVDQYRAHRLEALELTQDKLRTGLLHTVHSLQHDVPALAHEAAASELPSAREAALQTLYNELQQNFERSVRQRHEELQQHSSAALQQQHAALVAELRVERQERSSVLHTIQQQIDNTKQYIQQQSVYDAIAARVHQLAATMLRFTTSTALQHHWRQLTAAVRGDALLEHAVDCVPVRAVEDGIMDTQQLQRAFTLLHQQSAPIASVAQATAVSIQSTTRNSSLHTVNVRKQL